MEYLEHGDEFNEYLDEVYGTIDIAGITYYASSILAENDPIGYRCTYADWVDEYHPEDDDDDDDE